MSTKRSIWIWPQEWHPFLRGWLGAMLVFATLGTVSAVWANPFFVRMTPVGVWEFPALVLLALLSGVFVALPNACGLRRAVARGTAGFVGIACPTCNKIIVLIVGSEALLLWFDPMRPYVTASGIAVLSFAVWRKWRSLHTRKSLFPNEVTQ